MFLDSALSAHKRAGDALFLPTEEADLCAKSILSDGNLAAPSGMEKSLALNNTVLWRMAWNRTANFSSLHCDPPSVGQAVYTPPTEIHPAASLPLEIARFHRFEGRLKSNAASICGGITEDIINLCAGPRKASPRGPFANTGAAVTFQVLDPNFDSGLENAGYNMLEGPVVVVNLPEAEVRMASQGLAWTNATPDSAIVLPIFFMVGASTAVYRPIAGSHSFGVASSAQRSEQDPARKFTFDISLAADAAGLTANQTQNIVILHSTGAAAREIQNTTGFSNGRIVSRVAESRDDFSLGSFITALKDTQPPSQAQIAPVDRGDRHLEFAWLAPGDDGNEGRAAGYGIQWPASSSPPGILGPLANAIDRGYTT